jgi:hypothetical protein
VRWATVGYALGAAAGVSTLVYLLLASASGHNQPAASPTPGATPEVRVGIGERGTELVLQGSF